MEAIIIIKKNAGTNRVIETPVESFINRDSAVLKCAVLNRDESNKDTTYHICEVEHNESETVDAYRMKDQVFIEDEDGNEIEVDVETEADVHEMPFHETQAPDLIPFVKIKSISVYGTDLKHLDLSKELKRDIEHQADNVAEYLTEQIEP